MTCVHVHLNLNLHIASGDELRVQWEYCRPDLSCLLVDTCVQSVNNKIIVSIMKELKQRNGNDTACLNYILLRGNVNAT